MVTGFVSADSEQRELYEAAKCIQKAYRSYKGRKKLEEDKERSAAIVIQNYYRRYKQVSSMALYSYKELLWSLLYLRFTPPVCILSSNDPCSIDYSEWVSILLWEQAI